ncbi:hypothetical protein TNCT_138331 [Trichonephila clavata]|uniref:Transposase n=1 Tax=Trichonephila clavata TaxID=2740835 RepID=A0A8X6F5F3_TRICU|nr:hypothetical protein TNCT_138331 [Trichonephila clavata]
MPQHKMLAHLYHILSWHGLFRSNMYHTRRRRLKRIFNVEEKVLQSFEDNPNTGTRAIAQQIEVCQSAVWRILPEQGVHPCHLLSVLLFIDVALFICNSWS